jgi:hypothetical protein
MGFQTPEQMAQEQMRQWDAEWHAAHPDIDSGICACRDLFDKVEQSLHEAIMLAMDEKDAKVPLFAALMHASEAITALIVLVEAQK